MELIDIIPVVRMLLSNNGLVTCKAFANEKGELETTDNFAKEECLILKSVRDEQDLSQLVKKQLLEMDTLPKAVCIEGQGTIRVEPAGNGKGGIVQNRIIIVTGGAQGFGAGIAEELYEKGAHIVVADLNEEAGRAMVEKLRAKGKNNKAVFVRVNVGDSASVRNLVDQTVLELGGLDVLISNAGILRAGSLDEMDSDTFDLMTKVNYTGYFYCAKHASRIMKLQSSAASNHFMDIIQINSKSGLKGSNRNFAYAGGKFGGIGLTQSFALELMPNNIKVNSICPGNFFDGPLWSDPEKGLFVQYLKAGKVPGAKTIDDVQTFYEKQVPAGRGCRVNDVVKAILYVVDQDYETGQAIPVTGGQEMLR